MTRRKKDGLNGSMISLIVLSSSTVLIIFVGLAWLFVLKCGSCVHRPEKNSHSLMSSPTKPSGTSFPPYSSDCLTSLLEETLTQNPKFLQPLFWLNEMR